MIRFVPFLIGLLLAGCLTTPRPVFGPDDSLPAAESPAFMRFLEAWETQVSASDTPRELIEGGARVVELDGQLIVQEPKQDGSADYYSLGLLGTRPVSCALHDRGIREIAGRHAVSVTIDRSPGSDPALPAPIRADGSDAALRAFILDAFRVGNLACSAEGARD